MAIDWLELQEKLFEVSVKAIETFAVEHSRERFYGFAFDCNADYGTVLLCLNTEEEFIKSCRNYKYSDPASFKELRWGTGDWKYQGLGPGDADFESAWRPYAERVSDECIQQGFSEDPSSSKSMLLRSACRVLIRLEDAGVFQKNLKLTRDFTGFVADHDELDEESWTRLKGERVAGPDPDRYAKALEYANHYRIADGVFKTVEDERRKQPFTKDNRRLRDAAEVPPVWISENWWQIYRLPEEGIRVQYNSEAKTYRLTWNGAETIARDVAEVIKFIEEHPLVE